MRIKDYCFNKHKFLFLIFILMTLSLPACDKKNITDRDDKKNNKALESSLDISSPSIEQTENTTTNELIISEQLLKLTVDSSKKLKQSIQKFLIEESENNFNAVKTDWIRSHNNMQSFSPYLAIRQSNPGLFSSLEKFQIALDAQPIQPGFLDYFSEYSHSGIVNDIALPLTASNLRKQHGITDITDVSLGFHAIEYILWGEKGSRPLSDFIAKNKLSKTQEEEGLSIVDLPNNRRRTLLQLQADLLVDDLTALEKFWNNPHGLFKKTFFSLPFESRTQLIAAAATIRIEEEITLLGYFLDVESNDATNKETANSHNQFLNQNTSNVIAVLQTLKTSFFEDSSPLIPESTPLSNERQNIGTEIDAILEDLDKKTNEWPLEQTLAKKLNELLKNIINQLKTH